MPSLKLLADRLRLLRDLRVNDGTLTAPYQTVMIETTAICNLDCPICPVRASENVMERSVSQIKVEDFRRIVDLTKDMTESFCLNMWGESVLHKNFLELVDYVSATGRKIWFSTNLNYSERLAEALAPNPLLHIICSVDGWDPESYAEYRWRGRFDVMRRNLEILGRGRCTAYPQYLVSPGKESAKALFTAFIDEVMGRTDTIIFKTKLENLVNDSTTVVPGRCSSMYGGLYFNCDGTLMPCCTNVREDVFLRHVSTYTCDDLRNGDDIRDLRRRILDDKNQFDSCRACGGEDQQTLVLDRFRDYLKMPFAGKGAIPDPAKRG